MLDLTSFKVFDFSEGQPYVSITSNGVTFNKSVIIKLGRPSYVRLLLDATNQLMAIQVCDEADEKSVAFFKENEKGILSIRWNAKDLLNTISRITGWNLDASSYKVDGVLIPEQSLMLFDLNKAITLS